MSVERVSGPICTQYTTVMNETEFQNQMPLMKLCRHKIDTILLFTGPRVCRNGKRDSPADHAATGYVCRSLTVFTSFLHSVININKHLCTLIPCFRGLCMTTKICPCSCFSLSNIESSCIETFPPETKTHSRIFYITSQWPTEPKTRLTVWSTM